MFDQFIDTLLQAAMKRCSKVKNQNLRIFYVFCKFCTLTINFSEAVLPRQIPL